VKLAELRGTKEEEYMDDESNEQKETEQKY
jgi:hypothetical protein